MTPSKTIKNIFYLIEKALFIRGSEFLSYETELRKMMPDFELRNIYRNSSFELLTWLCEILK